jgi:hypothetical protein
MSRVDLPTPCGYLLRFVQSMTEPASPPRRPNGEAAGSHARRTEPCRHRKHNDHPRRREAAAALSLRACSLVAPVTQTWSLATASRQT